MNLGLERFLLLGCFAVLILELPQVFLDLRLGDGFSIDQSATSPVARLLPVIDEQPVSKEELESKPLQHGFLAQLEPIEAVKLPSTPGL